MAGVKLNRRSNISSTERVGQELGRVFFLLSCDCSGFGPGRICPTLGANFYTDTGAHARIHMQLLKYASFLASLVPWRLSQSQSQAGEGEHQGARQQQVVGEGAT